LYIYIYTKKNILTYKSGDVLVREANSDPTSVKTTSAGALRWLGRNI